MTGLVLHNGSWSLSKDSPFKMTVQANVPSLSWIGPLTGQPDMQLGGSVTLQISGNGTLGDPRLSGSVNGKDLAVNWLSMGVDLSKGELSAVLDGNRLQIRKGIIYGPEGNLQISGGLQMKNGQLLTSLYFKTDKLLILSNVDRQLAITGQGQFSLDENRLQLLGEWQVNRAMIILSDSRNVTYSKDVVVLGRPEKKTGESVPVSFNLKIDLGNQFYLKGKGLDTRLAGQIQAVSSRVTNCVYSERSIRSMDRIAPLDRNWLSKKDRSLSAGRWKIRHSIFWPDGISRLLTMLRKLACLSQARLNRLRSNWYRRLRFPIPKNCHGLYWDMEEAKMATISSVR